MVELFKGMIVFLIFAIIVFSLVFTCLTIYEKLSEKEAVNDAEFTAIEGRLTSSIFEVDLKADTVILVQCDQIISTVQSDKLIQNFRLNGIENKIIVLDGGLTVTVLKQPVHPHFEELRPRMETKTG